MSWVKLDDRALANRLMIRLPRSVRLLHIEALAYSNATGAGGAIPREALRIITDAADPEAEATLAVDAGIWDLSAEGWQLVFLLEDQPTAEEAEHQAERNRLKQRRRRLHLAGDHSLCLKPWCKQGAERPSRNPVSNRVTKPNRNPVPTRPDPLPQGEGEGKESDGGHRTPPTPEEIERAEAARLKARAVRDSLPPRIMSSNPVSNPVTGPET
jgi:hypothetical protein